MTQTPVKPSQTQHTQRELQEIQTRLQAISKNAGHPSPLPPMIEMTPNSNQVAHSPAGNRSAMKAPLPYTVEPGALSPEEIEALKRRAAQYVEQFQLQSLQLHPVQLHPLQHQPLQSNPPQSKSRTQAPSPSYPAQTPPRATPQSSQHLIQQLEAQVQRINHLSAEQENAMLELKAIATKAERDRRAAELDQSPYHGTDTTALCEYHDTAVPHIERDSSGSYVLTMRSVDLFRSEREANLMAQTLRNRTERPTQRPAQRRSGALAKRRSRSTGLARLGNQLWSQVIALLSTTPSSPTRKQPLGTDDSLSSSVDMPSFSLQDAFTWIIGSVVVRVGLDVLLASFPHLWLPVIGVIVAPAAIAIYRATVAPQSGFILGYRLLLVMIGLLLGGRL